MATNQFTIRSKTRPPGLGGQHWCRRLCKWQV